MLRLTIDTLARPWGFFGSMGILGVLALSAGLFFHQIFEEISDTQSALALQRSANFETAFSELVRLSLAARAIQDTDSPTAEQIIDLRDALDILFVRANHLSRFAQDETAFEFSDSKLLIRSARASTQLLKRIVDKADRGLANPDLDMATFSSEIDQDISNAMASISAYFLELNRAEQEFLGNNAETILLISRSIWFFLAIVCAALTFNTLLLRSEVKERKRREEMEKRAEFLAYFDTLTGLPNRHSFSEHVTAQIAREARISLVLADIDGFKDVNERMGQAMGDALLKEIAARCKITSEASGGYAARLGSDEFAICLPVDDQATLARVGRQLAHAMSEPVRLGGETIDPTLSLGAASLADITIATSPNYETAMRVTDFALEAAKKQKSTSLVLYDKALEEKFIEKRSMLRELPGAISQKELEVFCQPKVNMGTREVVGFEALVRWMRHGKYVSPVEFIPIAEEAGLIDDVDRYVMSNAVNALSAWNRRHGTEFTISVNVSAPHLLKDDLPAFVSKILEENDFAPELLTIEITETIELQDWSRVQNAIQRLSVIGVRISIDDFGTGYSSLAYLQAIRAHELKIDRSLVAKVEESDEARFVVDAVIDLAESLRLEVVVEGIERVSQIDVLSELGCVIGQGYYFGKPKAAEDCFAEATFLKGDAGGRDASAGAA